MKRLDASTSASPTADLLMSLFEALRGAAIGFVVLRNYSHLPQHPGNDVDILIDPTQRASAEWSFAALAHAHGFNITNRAEFSPTSLFVTHTETRMQLHVDLFNGLKWRGFDILRPEYVLAARQDRGLFFVPDPVHEATLNLLTRLLYHGRIRDKYKPAIMAAFRAKPHEARSTLTQSFGERGAGDLVAGVLAGDWSAIEAETGRWRRLLITRQLARYPRRTLSCIREEGSRLARRFAEPPGLMLVMLGPDGSGKSSVAEGVMHALEPTFGREKSEHLHWKPRLFRRGQGEAGPVTDPHGRPVRGPLASVVYFALHWIEFVLGAQLRLRPALFRNHLVIVDRYFHDFLVDPMRYRLDVPQRLIRWAFKLVMKPDLAICLDAPPEVLRARKQEVSPEETDRQRHAYVELARTQPNARVVDASRPLDEVIAEVEEHVLAYLTARVAQRMGWGET